MNMEIDQEYKNSHRIINAGDNIDGDQRRAMTSEEYQEAK
jgi:hypothetical protein